MIRSLMALVVITLVIANSCFAQQALSLDDVAEALDREGSVTLERLGVVLSNYDYDVEGGNVEAIVFRPKVEGVHPGIVLIPGYSRTARDYIPLGVQLAREGFACVAVTQRGFGRSEGNPDFVGPRTIAALEAGFLKFREEDFVDGERMGLFGYSRGAMAASLLACRLTKHGLRGAVFAAGIYDLKQAYADIEMDGIRENIEQETGMSELAMVERSSIQRMEHLTCPVLVLHGSLDENAPISQAYILRDRLQELNKEFEIKVYPDRAHDLGRENLNSALLEFFQRQLADPNENGLQPQIDPAVPLGCGSCSK